MKYIESGGTYTVFDGMNTLVFDESFPNYEELVKLVIEEDLENLKIAYEYSKTFVKENLKLDVEDGYARYKNQVIPSGLLNKFMKLEGTTEDKESVHNFIERLMLNPSNRVINQLDLFLNHLGIPIHQNGKFYAYKAVRTDYYDIYTGTIKNEPGKTISVPRQAVDDDPNRTCSHGLHVGGYDYATTFGGSNSYVMLVEVDPADVVAVPTDYDGQKMRVCSYKVIAIFGDEQVLDEQSSTMYLVMDKSDEFTAKVFSDMMDACDYEEKLASQGYDKLIFKEIENE